MPTTIQEFFSSALAVLQEFIRKMPPGTFGMSWIIRTRWTGYNCVGKYRYFTDQELSGLDDNLCQMLSIARGKANVPFVITCGLRTPEQNAALSESVSDSAHLTGHAVDLACADSPSRFAMLKALLDTGFTRIGVYSAHLHCDTDSSKAPNVIWYVSGT